MEKLDFKKELLESSGLLLINKPENLSSQQVVRKLKGALKLHKAGHIGTLDPFASGVFVILTNEATKVASFFNTADKEYEFSLKLGVLTNTLDITGKVLRKFMVRKKYSTQTITKVLNSFLGSYHQKVPNYAAVKVNGMKLYQYSRLAEKKVIKIPKIWKDVEIFGIKLSSYDRKNNIIKATTHCSKGTYIRQLGKDIAQRLGTVGTISSLKRTKFGVWKISECSSLILNSDYSVTNGKEIGKQLIDINKLLTSNSNFVKGVCNDSLVPAIRNGNIVELNCFLNNVKVNDSVHKYIVIFDLNNNLIAIYERDVLKKAFYCKVKFNF